MNAQDHLRRENAEWLAAAETANDRASCLAEAARIDAKIVEFANRPKFRHIVRRGVEEIEMLGVRSSRIIEGVAATPRVSTSGIGNTMSLSPSGCEAKLPIPLFSEHTKTAPIGVVFHIVKFKYPGRVWVRAAIHESGEAAGFAWDLIVRGEVSSFSVLAETLAEDGIVDGVHFVTRWRLKELSIVRTPSNVECLFYTSDVAQQRERWERGGVRTSARAASGR